MQGNNYVRYLGDNGMAIGGNIQSQPMRWTSSDAAPQILTSASWAGDYTLGNQAGTVIATYPRIVRWKLGADVSETLGTLTTTGFVTDYAYAVNGAGTIVGALVKTGAGFRAVRWSNDGTAIEELASLPNVPASTTSASYALDVNRDGYIVGVAPSSNGFGSQRAVLWSPDNQVFSLDSALGTNSNWKGYSYASGISDVGFVSGVGTFDPDGSGPETAYARLSRAYIWSGPGQHCLHTFGRQFVRLSTRPEFAASLRGDRTMRFPL
jgi:hypothetical protein